MIHLKKLLFKAILLCALVASYFFLEPVHNILDKEINTLAITSFLSQNLYKGESSVASEPMSVKDYVLKEERLYIFPLGNEVVLPIDVMVVSVEEGAIEVINSNTRYKISHINNRIGKLYQYIHSLNPLAYTDDFFVIEGDDLETLAGRINIYYEKV